MEDDVFKRIVLLIENKMGKYRKRMNEETCLEKDLGMIGDDAVEFLIDFGKEFNVDVSKFNFTEYFHPEGDSILPAIIRLFTNKKNPKKGELTIGHLVKAVKLGRLDNELINNRP